MDSFQSNFRMLVLSSGETDQILCEANLYGFRFLKYLFGNFIYKLHKFSTQPKLSSHKSYLEKGPDHCADLIGAINLFLSLVIQ